MKILGGKYRGRNFYMPAGIRPSLNVTRKAVFDFIGHDLEGLEFLELFSGSGAVGLEALSRGAKKAVFVDSDLKCCAVIEENLALLGIKEKAPESCEVIRGNAFLAIKMLARRKKKFDFVFLDPPYSRGLVKKALKTLMACDILHPNSIIIVEFAKREALPEAEGRFFLVTKRKYGKAFLAVYQNH